MHQVAGTSNSVNRSNSRSITCSRSATQSLAKPSGPNRSRVPQINSKSRLMVNIPLDPIWMPAKARPLLVAYFLPACRLLVGALSADNEHVRKLTQQRQVSQRLIARLPGPQHPRQRLRRCVLNPINRADIDPMYFGAGEARGIERTTQPARGGEILLQLNQGSDSK